jgi:hypothetical protein
MAPFSGIFLRHQLGDTPSHVSGGWSNSPDLIPYSANVNNVQTPEPMPDPSVAVSQTDYNNDQYPSTVFLNQYNYVYIRGLNTTGGATNSRFWFFYTESDLALWPQNWRSDNVTYQGTPQNYVTVSAASANQIIINPQPLVWRPTPLAPNTHYCMIGFSETPPAANPVSPAPVGGFGTLQDLINFILANPNMAWRNTVDVFSNQPTWQQTTQLTGPATAGPINVGLQFVNMPVGSTYSYSVPGPDAANTIIQLNQPVVNPNQEFSVTVQWPANYQTSIMVSYYQGNAPAPPTGAAIVPTLSAQASQLPQSLLKLAARRTRHQPRLVPTFDSAAMIGISPIWLVRVGSVPYRFRQPY